MWSAIRTIRLLLKSLGRIAAAAEDIRELYRLDLASRGVVPMDGTLHDPVEISYGFTPTEEE